MLLLQPSGKSFFPLDHLGCHGMVTLETGYFGGELTTSTSTKAAFPVGYNIGSNTFASQHGGTAIIKGQIITSQNTVSGTPIQVNGGSNACIVQVYLDPILYVVDSSGNVTFQDGLPAAGLIFNGGIGTGGPGPSARTSWTLSTRPGATPQTTFIVSMKTHHPRHPRHPGPSTMARCRANRTMLKLSYNAYVQKLEIDGNGGLDNVTVHVANIVNTSTVSPQLPQFWLNAAPGQKNTLKIDASGTNVTQQYAVGYVLGTHANPSVGVLAPDVALASLTWTAGAPNPTTLALPYGLPAKVPQTFSINNVALMQYFGGTGMNNCAINNTNSNSLMVAAGKKGTLIGGFGSNELLGGPGPSQLFGRGVLDGLLANYTVNYPSGLAVGANGTLQAITPPGTGNYVYDWPNGPPYCGFVFYGNGDQHNTNTNNVILPIGATGLKPTEWLRAVFYSSANIIKIVQASPLLQKLPGCPDETTFV